MFAPNLLSLLMTCSALRIQQKDKGASACPIAACSIATQLQANSANPSSTPEMCLRCECYLKGYMSEISTGAGSGIQGDTGNNLGACGWKSQAQAGFLFSHRMTECAGNWWQNAVGSSLARGRWSNLYSCLTSNLPISARAVINPSGVNPFWLDPIVNQIETARIQGAAIAKKVDIPGSLPIADCATPNTMDVRTWVEVCRGGVDGTMTFDGAGACCTSAAGSDVNPADQTEEGCKAAALDSSNVGDCGLQPMISWASGGHCRCDVNSLASCGLLISGANSVPYSVWKTVHTCGVVASPAGSSGP